MLLGDGSPTRHLQLLTNQETKIKLISMQLDPLSTQEGPTELNQLNGPLIRRQVSVSYTHLRAHETGRNLVCRLLLEKKKEYS